MRMSRSLFLAVLAVALLGAGMFAGPADAAPGRAAHGRRATVNPYPGYTSAVYTDKTKWLCRPDMKDVCDRGLDATVVREDGTTSAERWWPSKAPRVDCFYIYPTISTDPGGNSDFVPSPNEELFVVQQQAARLGKVCRVFAPVYRQVTLTALTARLAGNPIPADRALAYGDVVDAWKQYIAHDNHGRGVILIGHSQGSGMLTELIKHEIDNRPVLRHRLVSAMLLGTSLQVPDGKDVGGDFQHVPLCHSRSNIGCVITYASFRSTAPPPANSLFGGSAQPGRHAACTNPAALATNHDAPLHPYFPTNGASLPILQVPPPQWVDPASGVTITTPMVTLPGLVSSQCRTTNGFTYLAVTVHPGPGPRIDDIGGDLTPEWGLHLVDANVAMGDLTKIASYEAAAFVKRANQRS
jgi:hypothetical protein